MQNSTANSERAYASQLQEIGAMLRHAREAQGLDMATVAEKTLIRSSLLEAMEQGDMARLPEPVYVRGLIRRYGDFLAIDGSSLASQFFAVSGSKSPSWRRPIGQLRPLHLYLAYILVMIAAISGLSYLLRRTTPQVGTLPPLEPLSQPVESPNRSPEAAVPTPAPTPPPDAPIQVEMTLTAQSWLRIVVDGDTEFEGILQQGESRSWTADQQLTIRAGNAGGVVVSYNNGQSERLGEPGMVAEVTFAPETAVSPSF